MSRAELAALGAGLGADVPCLLFPYATRGRGIGEQLERIPTDLELPLLLLKPALALPTPAMYRRIDERGIFGTEEAGDRMVRALEDRDPAAVAAALANDFEEVVTEPQVAEAARALRKAGALGARMTGSGSAVFGIFADRDCRDKAAAALAGGPWQCFSCTTVNEA